MISTEPTIPDAHDPARSDEPVTVTARLDALLARAEHGPLDADTCRELSILVRDVPGRRRRVATALGAQRNSAAVDGLLTLPMTVPGVVEGLYRAFAAGVTRTFEPDDNGDSPRGGRAVLALDFRTSRSRQFPALLRRARLAAGSALERLELARVLYYRLALWADAVRPADGDADPLASWRPPREHETAGRLDPVTFGPEFTWLHGQLGKLRGTRLWINGWCFPHTRVVGAVTPAVQVHLVRAWLEGVAARAGRTT